VEIDIRSDVYSLGVVLYELLCGQLPYNCGTTTLMSAARMIQTTDPPRPSAVRRTLRGNLDAILTKVLDKEPHRRYASAAQLCADIRSHLAGDRVIARPLTPLNRCIRSLSRHPLLTTVFACALMILGSIAISIVSIRLLRAVPHHMSLRDDGREARLESIAGDIVHTWQVQSQDGIGFAVLEPRSQQVGGGSLAILGFTRLAANGFQGAIVAIDSRGPFDKPTWEIRISNDDVPPGFHERGLSVIGFSPDLFLSEDFFPALSGNEYFVTFRHAPTSACCLMILDSAGNVLYRIWHDGAPTVVKWWRDTRLLVLGASNAEVFWRDRGHDSAFNDTPRVLFAIEPILGHLSLEWTSPSPGRSMVSVAWYQCLLPESANDWLELLTISDPYLPEHQGRCLLLNHVLDPDSEVSPGVGILIDRHGLRVPDFTVFSDKWQLDPPPIDVTGLYFGPLPPAVEGAQSPFDAARERSRPFGGEQ
jgi:hypothetical protein